MARGRISAERLATPLSARSAGHLALAWGGYAVLAWVAATTSAWPLKVVAWLAMAWLLLGNGAVGHEAVHAHLFRSRLGNRAVGTVAGLSLLMPWAVYKPFHLGHHQHTVDELDPEGIPPVIPSRAVYPIVLLGGPVFIVQLAWHGLKTAAGRGPWWVRGDQQRRDITVGLALLAGGLVAVGTGLAVAPGTVVDIWLVPWLMAMLVLFPFALLPEHYGAIAGGDVFDTTRSVISNPLLRWVFWNNNFHAPHHLAPGVVHQHLPRAQALVDADQPASWRSPSYLAFHKGLVSALPWHGRD